MRAIVFEEFGPPEVLKIKEIEKPVPAENDVLIKISASKIGFGDLLMRNLDKINAIRSKS